MSKYASRLLTQEDDAAWDALWESSGDRWFSQRPGFVRAITPVAKRRVVGVFDGERLVLAAPFFVRKGRRITSWTQPVLGPFCGPLVGKLQGNRRTQERFWREAFEALASAGGDVFGAPVVDLVCPPGVDDLRGLGWSGWDLRPHYTYVSRWSADGEFAGGVKSSVRSQARKAARDGVVVEFAGASVVGGVRALWAETAARAGLDDGIELALAPAGEWMESNDAGFCAIARDRADGQALAAALVGHDAGRVYYLAGASSSVGMGSDAPSLLQMEIMAEIERRGLPRCYDWAGANTASVCSFKRHFGPEVEVLVAARRVSSATRVLDALRGWLRGVG